VHGLLLSLDDIHRRMVRDVMGDPTILILDIIWELKLAINQLKKLTS